MAGRECLKIIRVWGDRVQLTQIQNSLNFIEHHNKFLKVKTVSSIARRKRVLAEFTTASKIPSLWGNAGGSNSQLIPRCVNLVLILICCKEGVLFFQIIARAPVIITAVWPNQREQAAPWNKSIQGGDKCRSRKRTNQIDHLCQEANKDAQIGPNNLGVTKGGCPDQKWTYKVWPDPVERPDPWHMISR